MFVKVCFVESKISIKCLKTVYKTFVKVYWHDVKTLKTFDSRIPTYPPKTRHLLSISTRKFTDTIRKCG